MFIEPTFSHLLHKVLTTKPGSTTDEPFVMPNLPEDDHYVAIYDDQGREMSNRRAWHVEAESDAARKRERRPAY